MLAMKRRENIHLYKNMVMVSWATIFILVLGLYVLMQQLVLRNVRNNTERNIRAELTTCEDGIDRIMSMIDKYIYDAYYMDSEESISSLLFTVAHGDALEQSMAKRSLINTVKGMCTWSDNISFAMLFGDDKDEDICIQVGAEKDYALRQQIIRQFTGENGMPTINNQYLAIRYNDNGYLLRIMKLEKTYFVIGMNENVFVDTINTALYSRDSIIFAIDGSGELFFSTGGALTDNMQLSEENEGMYLRVNGKKYLQTGCMSQHSGIYFAVLTDQKSIEGSFAYVRTAFYVVLGVLTILFIVINQMAGHIQNLKIERYKATLEAQKATLEAQKSAIETQKATMQYLQTQIKPHFYANALNIIYSLAETKDYAAIQKMSKAIVNFSRYKFQDATELVELKRECEHVAYFMQIQEIRYSKQVELTQDIREEYFSALIPPFVIQSFVENSSKYAFASKKMNHITIKAELKNENLIITVSDDGRGYPEDMLGHGWLYKETEGHIGLKNVYRRLQLIYDDDADIELSNDNGAHAKITIPFISTDIADIDD